FVCLCDHFICIFSFFQRYAAPRALHSFPTRRSSDLRNAASDRAREEPLMLNQADNTLLTRIEPGTPMGAMLREYWVPACRSAKLEADGAPEKVRLFGESFVAFRATDGRVGFMQEARPHRCVSLALARNEDNGLRCVFHGWKFNVEGKCVDAPTEPRAQRARFAESVPVRSHPVHEAGGLVWVYMGAKDTPPRFP